MLLAMVEVPADPAAPSAFDLACRGELKVAQTAVHLKALEIRKLCSQIAKLRRMQFGWSSERITRQIEQPAELETFEAEDVARAEADDPDLLDALTTIAEDTKSTRSIRCFLGMLNPTTRFGDTNAGPAVWLDAFDSGFRYGQVSGLLFK